MKPWMLAVCVVAILAAALVAKVLEAAEPLKAALS